MDESSNKPSDENVFLANARIPAESPIFQKGEILSLNGRVAPEPVAFYPVEDTTAEPTAGSSNKEHLLSCPNQNQSEMPERGTPKYSFDGEVNKSHQP